MSCSLQATSLLSTYYDKRKVVCCGECTKVIFVDKIQSASDLSVEFGTLYFGKLIVSHGSLGSGHGF